MGWLADLLKEIPSAARYKAELDELSSKHAVLKSENSILKAKLLATEEVIRGLNQQLSNRHSVRLDEVRERVLLLVAKESGISDSHIAESLQIGIQVAEFHINELLAMKYITRKRPKHQTWYVFEIDQGGRKYLAAHGLLT